MWVLLIGLGLLSALLEMFYIPKNRHALRSRVLLALPFGMLLAACGLGGWRFQSALPIFSPEDVAFYQPLDDVVLTGTITSFPQRSSSATTAIVSVDSLQAFGHTYMVAGQVDVRLPAGFHLSYGDRLRLAGNLDGVVEDSQPYFTSHLARRGVFSRMPYPQIDWISSGHGSQIYRMLYSLRARAQTLIYNQVPFPESSLLEGILLGIEWNIPGILRQAYRGTGLIHIIAISGFNIALIANVVAQLFRRIFPHAWAAVLSICAIFFYTLLVGAEPAVVRAAIMGSLAIPAHYIGRRIFGLHALVVAASLMLLFNPFLLWDISFQLSFLATMGLMLLVDPLATWVHGIIDRHFSEQSADRSMPLLMLVITTFAAQFAVSPVLFALDPYLPVFALLANLIILPLQPIVMILGALSVLAGWLFPLAGRLLGWLVWPFIALGNQVAMRISLNPFSQVRLPEGSAAAAAMLVAACCIMASVVDLHRIARGNPHSPE
jgi:competence protein ComEC